jgi:hypothetical protein
LHVQVAEALGCAPSLRETFGAMELIRSHPWICACIDRPHADDGAYVKRYDMDWSATGPLIEKFQIALDPEYSEEPKFLWRAEWLPRRRDRLYTFGPTALDAVCNLLLVLKETGKL